ncbi:DUF4013 domain-containing protein [Methanobrevibacter sp.]|uniref:DUF4013 domain-containing protein n=1 Tax=Methanobrevibacter sp. TaxID=66852 RepID=UPI00386D2D15
MEIMEIIKESLIFPSNDLAKLAIYIALTFAAGILAVLGIVLFAIGAYDNIGFSIIGAIVFIAGLIIIFILTGYLVSIVKSGIDQADAAPEFVWKENLIVGIKFVIMNIVYFIIPAIVVLIVGWATNLFGNAISIFNQIMIANMMAPANTTVMISEVVPQSQFVALGTAMIITGIIAFILFLIFAFLQTMGEARLANTGSLGSSVNIVESFKDIGRIGWGKVIAVVLLIFIIIAVINVIINGLNSYITGFSILSIIVTPYLTFFASRATGLLYSDIA